MFIARFIDDIDREIALTPELEEKLFTVIIPNGLGEILDYIFLNEGVYKLTLSNQNNVKLPLDFGFPIDLTVDNVPYERLQSSKIRNTANSYSINLGSDKYSYNTPLRIDEVLSMSLYPLRSKQEIGYRISVVDIDGDNSKGYIYDNENIFYPADNTAIIQARLDVEAGDDIIRIKDGDTLYIKTMTSILKIPLREGVTEYYLAEDGSIYSDSGLTDLIVRAKPIRTPRILEFGAVSYTHLTLPTKRIV